MNANETREARLARLLEMSKNMTHAEIARVEGKSRARISQLIGPSRTTNPILLDVHAFISQYQKTYHVPPTMPQIAKQFPTRAGKPRSTSVIDYWLSQMERLGMIERIETPGSRRAIVARKLPRSQAVQEMREQRRNGDSHANEL